MSKLSPARRINVGALLVAAAGVFIVFVSAPDLFPAVPPGILILAAAAAIVAFVPGRWTPIVGVLIPLVITIGGIANGTSIDILQGEENAGAILGTSTRPSSPPPPPAPWPWPAIAGHPARPLKAPGESVTSSRRQVSNELQTKSPAPGRRR
jgi:hypothetical protein